MASKLRKILLKEVTKQEKSRFFLLFLLNVRRIQIWTRIRIRIHTSDKWIRIRIWIQEAQKHVDPGDLDPDPDPQHCSYVHIEFLRP
jgi:hypothetical protein